MDQPAPDLLDTTFHRIFLIQRSIAFSLLCGFSPKTITNMQIIPILVANCTPESHVAHDMAARDVLRYVVS